MHMLLGNGDAEVKVDQLEKRVCSDRDVAAAIVAADVKHDAVTPGGERPAEIGVDQQSAVINLAFQKECEVRVLGYGPKFGPHPAGNNSARYIDDVDGNARHRVALPHLLRQPGESLRDEHENERADYDQAGGRGGADVEVGFNLLPEMNRENLGSLVGKKQRHRHVIE